MKSLPDGWCWTTIEEVCSKIGSGSTPRGGNYSKEGIPFFRSQNVYNSGIVLTDIKYISNEVHQSMNGTEVVANDLLLNITGGSLGRCAIIPSNFDKGNVSQHVCILRTVLVKPDYLHAFILSSFFANSMKITGSGREGLPKYNLEKMLLPLPPIKEQERIISETERLQTFVDQIEISEGKLSEFILQAKSKILDLAIHGKLVPQDPMDEPASELLKRINPKAEKTCDNQQYGKPKGWCECTIGSLFLFIRNGVNIRQDKSKIGFPITRIETISSEFIDRLRMGYAAISDESYSDYYLQKDEILMSHINSPIHIGKCALCDIKPGEKIIHGMNLLCLRPYPDIISKYILMVFRSTYFKNEIRPFIKNAVNQASINIRNLSSAHLLLPPVPEQHRIVAKIEELFAQLDNIASSL